MSQVLTADDFMPYVGETFLPKGQHRRLTLTAVTTNASAGWEGMTRQPFTLILHGPPDDLLAEGLYDVAVEAGPEFALYIIPIQTLARDRQDYQVVFN